MTKKQYNARKNTDDDFKERLKVELEDIVGLVKTDDVTDSVELKKEYYDSKSKNKRYEEMYSKYCGLVVADMSTNPRICSARRISDMEIVDELNQLNDENEELKKENKHLRCTIESNSQDDYIDYLKSENEQLKSANMEMEDYLGRLEEENGRMKGSFKRKFDYDIEDVVDEICDEDW